MDKLFTITSVNVATKKIVVVINPIKSKLAEFGWVLLMPFSNTIEIPFTKMSDLDNLENFVKRGVIDFFNVLITKQTKKLNAVKKELKEYDKSDLI